MSEKKLIKIITTSWNETENIDRFILWYRTLIPNCDITILDNESDPEYFSYLKEVSKKHNISLGIFKTNGKLGEEGLINIRNNYWKKFIDNYSYILIVDLDELVTIDETKLVQSLNEDWDYCKLEGYNVIAEVLASPSKDFSKPVLFKTDNISEMNLFAGGHNANPINKKGKLAVQYKSDEYKLYHFKWVNLKEGFLRTHKVANKGRTELTEKNKWSVHYAFEDKEHIKYCLSILETAEPHKILIWFYEISLKNKL